MRYWYKYLIKSTTQLEKVLPIDNSRLEHTLSLSVKNEINIYENKYSFYEYFFNDFHLGRLEEYDDFLRSHLQKQDQVLSIASGRSVNELRLIDEGYDIFCTDLYKFDWYDKTKELWPNYRFSILDIIKNSSINQYDTVLGLSVIFIFNDLLLNDFFKNINKSLKNHGHLILDSSGSPDNISSFFIHDILLKFEIYLIKFIKMIYYLGKKKFKVIKKHHGYRRTNSDIIMIAEKNGFKLMEVKNYAFLTEFSRSYILSFVIRNIPIMKRLFVLFGSKIPYVRMFLFKKIREL